MLRGANLPTPSGGRDSSREVWLSSACVLPGCEWRLLVEAGCAQASSNFRREMRWLRAPVPATRARNGRTRGKRDIRPSVSACRGPRTRHWRVLAETLRFLAPCVTVLRGPESYTSSDDSSPHPVPQLPRCRGPARMPADRQDVQPALGHDLLASPVPRLLPRLWAEAKEEAFIVPPARNLRCFRPRVLFIFLISQL